ncbi:ArsR/SmtB family transcription factor [Nakamurella lactea]|uniref:ArsR/SmtB family transcription factor n=1 Tax=Nakamurella lactea TaxID=459515 RepID=UPI0004256EC7|nr:winged helix-turn-helix domain-containing protein [Nakamurella lactea]
MSGPPIEHRPEITAGDVPFRRRPATLQEAKAVAHPLRLRILRLCTLEELTNKQLADRLDRDPGTVLYHVKQLVDAGLLEPAPVRTGASGALEKPYRATGVTRWLETTLAHSVDGGALAPVLAMQQELQAAGPDAIEKMSRFVLHLRPEQLEELALRVVEVLDDYTAGDGERLDQPVYSGMFLLHRLGAPGEPQ